MKTNPSPPNDGPKYHHVCCKCVFLGHVVICNGDADIYFCDGSLLWRHSDEESDYGSSPYGYITPLCPFGMVALALYVRHLAANGSTMLHYRVSKDGKTVLENNL